MALPVFPGASCIPVPLQGRSAGDGGLTRAHGPRGLSRPWCGDSTALWREPCPGQPCIPTDTRLHACTHSEGAPLQAEPPSGRPRALDASVPCGG